MFNFFRKKMLQHPTAPELYHYVKGRVFDPGAESFVFVDNNRLPLYSVVGNGNECGTLRNFGQPLVYVNHSITRVGLGGLQAGQFMSTPLTDNEFQQVG